MAAVANIHLPSKLKYEVECLEDGFFAIFTQKEGNVLLLYRE